MLFGPSGTRRRDLERRARGCHHLAGLGDEDRLDGAGADVEAEEGGHSKKSSFRAKRGMTSWWWLPLRVRPLALPHFDRLRRASSECASRVALRENVRHEALSSPHALHLDRDRIDGLLETRHTIPELLRHGRDRGGTAT